MKHILDAIKTNSSIVGGQIINDSSKTDKRIMNISEKLKDYISDEIGGGSIKGL